MPKRGIDADSRIFFDELVSVSVSRLRATGAIRLEDRHGIMPSATNQTRRRRSYEVPERRLVVLFSLPEVRSQKPKSFGSSTMHHAAGSASKSLACAIAPLTASAGPSV